MSEVSELRFLLLVPVTSDRWRKGKWTSNRGRSKHHSANEGSHTYVVGHIRKYNTGSVLELSLYDTCFKCESDINDIQIIPTEFKMGPKNKIMYANDTHTISFNPIIRTTVA